MSYYRNMVFPAWNPLFRRTAMAAVTALVVAGGVFSMFATTNANAANPYAGRQVYQNNCALCHKTGLNAAPKYGNKKAWEPRISQGKETLYNSAINGKGSMPPKGGHPNLTEEEVKTAVDYMVGAAGGWPDS